MSWPGTKCSAGELGADIDQHVGIDPELGELSLRLDPGLGEVTADRLAHVLHLDIADPELQGRIALFPRCAARPGNRRSADRNRQCVPSSLNSRDMPSFWAMRPVRIEIRLQLDFDVDAGGKIELHQGIDGLRRRIDNVEDPLVRPDLELLTRLLVDVRRSQTVNRSIRVGSGIGPRPARRCAGPYSRSPAPTDRARGDRRREGRIRIFWIFHCRPTACAASLAIR